MKTPKFLLPVATAGVLALTLSACGGGGGTTAGADAEQGLDGRGPITYVQGKDNSNVVRPLIEKWNAAHPNEKVTFKEQTDQADQQHDDLVQNFQAKNANYDVVERRRRVDRRVRGQGLAAAAQGQDGAGHLDDAEADRRELPRTRARCTRHRRTSDGGILYYRKDLVPTRAQDLGRDDGHVLRSPNDEQHRLLRRPVRQVRGPDRQRLRGHQLRRRSRAGRGRQAEPDHP